MAVTFELNSTGLATIDLTDTSSSIFLQEAGYVPVVATPTGDGSIPPYVTETIPVGLHATSYNGYATLMQNLAALQKRAAEYWVEQQQPTPVWLECKMDNETTGRQALVKSINFEFRPWADQLYQECGTSVPPGILLGTMLIERHPYWEVITAKALANQGIGGAAAVTYSPIPAGPGPVLGDVAARINALAIRSGTGGATLWRLWMGIRSTTLHGATGVTAFESVWECEHGTNIADASIADDAASEPNTASAGGGIGAFVNVNPEAGGAAIDWDDGDFHQVHSITMTQAGYTTYSDGFGRFLWLLRTKVESGEWEVRIATGYDLETNLATRLDPVSVTNASWDYKEMGVREIGGRNRQAIEIANMSVASDITELFVFARRISGAGDLMLDCLCPIPIDEGFLKVFDGYMTTTYDCYFGQGPKEDSQVISVGSGPQIAQRVPYELENFRLPPGQVRIICVYARETSSVLTDGIEFGDPGYGASQYTERWTALRGGE